MKISVCIVTRDRAVSLERALRSILASSPGVDFEVLVIDNSADPAFSQNQKTCRMDPRIRHLRSDWRIGIAALRQIGVDASLGQVLAFVDDDIVLPPEWLPSLRDAFEADPGLGIYGCAVQNFAPDGTPEGYAGHGLPKKQGTNGALRPAAEGDAIVSFGEANLALRREFVLAAGSFDPRFCWGHEGVDLTFRMLARGCRLRYNPGIVIQHRRSERLLRPGIDRSEYYRLLYFFKYFPLRRFSIGYELRRIYYFALQRKHWSALSNCLSLLAVPLILLEAGRTPRYRGHQEQNRNRVGFRIGN